MRKTLPWRVVFAALACVSAATVHAATAQQTFGVRLIVQESCTIGAAPTDVDFGTVTRQAGAVTTDGTAGSLSINCTSGTPYVIALNGGLNANGTSRRMAHATLTNTYAPYELYKEAARTNLWGNGTTFGTTVSGVGTGAAVPLSVYGRMNSRDFPAGTYNDTVTATITY